MATHYGKRALRKANRVLSGVVVVPSKVMSERCECFKLYV